MNSSMLSVFGGLILCLLSSCEVVPETVKIPQRTMGVTLGPENVFDRPVGELIPQLEGAVATNVNGRVGPELVFWSYRLADTREALFFACADLEGVDCSARIERICPARALPSVISNSAEPGEVRALTCRAISTVGIGEIRPSCDDTDFVSPLVIGLATCP